MIDSKLIELLSCFTPKELKQLQLMVDSPYFNNQASIRKLMEFLMEFAPDFNHPKLTYHHAFVHIYGKKDIQSDQQTAVLKVMSKLSGLIKDCIVQFELIEYPIHRLLSQAHFFSKKQMLEHIPKLLDEAESLVSEIPYRNEFYFRHKLLLEFERSSFLNIIQDKSSFGFNLSQQNQALDNYYAISKLQTYCFAKNIVSLTNFDFDFSQMLPFMEWIKASKLTDDFGIRIWYLALEMLNEPNTTHFDALKNNISQYKKELDPPVIRVLYSYLANIAPLIYTDRETYIKEIFELYKEQIELGILYINGYLSPVLLRNITVIGLKRREFDWVETFLEQNADKIVPSYLEREDIIMLCKAYLYFAKGDFHRTLDMINMLRCDNTITKMDERRLRLMCYYEIDFTNPFDDLINSFRKFLTDHKKKIPFAHIEVNRLFIHYIHKVAMSNYLSRGQIKLLFDEIQQVSVLPEKEWLLSKVEERMRR